MRFAIAVIGAAFCVRVAVGGLVVASAADRPPAPRPVEFVVSIDLR